jgi:hypothetical protein
MTVEAGVPSGFTLRMVLLFGLKASPKARALSIDRA